MRYFENEQKRKIAQNVHKQVGWQIWSLSAGAQQDKKLTITEAGSIAAAVLVAIAIPVFTNQLEKSREATDAANIRAAYAEVMAAALDDPDNDHEAEVTKKQTQADWVAELDIAGVSSNDITGGAGTITVKYTASTGKTTIDGKEVTATFMK